MKNKIEVHDELIIPARRELCPVCDGDRVSSAYLGEISMEENDEEWLEAYFNGRFDRTCEECEGKGYVLVADYGAMTEKMANEYHEWLEDEHQARMEREAERRAGA